MLYKIKDIVHAGFGGTRADEPDYAARIGRIVNIDWEKVDVGARPFIGYVKDKDGSDYSHKVLIPSRVYDIWVDSDYNYHMATENSVYIFEEITED